MTSTNDGRLDKGSGCYFYAQFAADSFCGHLDPVFEAAEGLTEKTIADFVRAAKPSLFRQLGGLLVSSTGVRRHHLASEQVPSKPAPADASAASDTPVVKPQYLSVAHGGGQLSTIRQPSTNFEQYMLDLQYKRYIQLRVLNGYDLTIRKLTVSSLVLPCSDPQCATKIGVIPTGAFFLTLSKSTYDQFGEVNKKSVLHYNLTCLEALFDRGLSVKTPYEVDGKFDQSKDTTLSLHQFPLSKVDGHFDSLLDDSDLPCLYPSNSPEALYLRQKRHDEFATIPITPVRPRTTVKSVPTSAATTPNLKLSRPDDVSPYDRRYKKQGLRYENIRKSRTSKQRQHKEHSVEKSPTKPEVRICYCREPADGFGLIQCSSPACMIGTFHLRCLELEVQIEEGDAVYCSYCAEDLGADESCETEAGTLSPIEQARTETGCECLLTSPASEPTDGMNIHNGMAQLEQPEAAANFNIGRSNNVNTPSHTGFMAINDPTTCPDIYRRAQADGPHSPVPATPYLKPTSTPTPKTKPKRQKKQGRVSLQPGSSQISFADLAPFISLSHLAYSPLGLTNKEAQAFLDWKKACPKSRLLEALPIEERVRKGLSPSDVWYPVNSQGYVLLQEGFAPRKLSELLDTVGG